MVSLLKKVDSVNGSRPDSNIELSELAKSIQQAFLSGHKQKCTNLFSRPATRESVRLQNWADRSVAPSEPRVPVIQGPPVTRAARSTVPMLARKTCLKKSGEISLIVDVFTMLRTVSRKVSPRATTIYHTDGTGELMVVCI